MSTTRASERFSPDMGVLDGRRVVLGVTGGIAAYKSVEVCRLLTDAGAHVTPVLTKAALRFVGRATFDSLASEATQVSLWDEKDPIPHTRLGQQADLILVCPATARLLADFRNGRSSDLLTATLLATRSPVIVCPAMHTEMWEQPAVAENVATLIERGVIFVGPAKGPLAGGDAGEGRLADPTDVVDAVVATLTLDGSVPIGDMTGLTVLVTAGGTREPMGPVRYIGNRSSGKQGHALAIEAASRGAKVLCVTTQSETAPEMIGVEIIPVETADEMKRAVTNWASDAEIVFMAAAVADFRPAEVASQKIKKVDGVPELRLTPTTDILAELGKHRPRDQVLVGFAAETTNLKENATAKLVSKGIDLIVANDVSAPGVGFGHDTNAVVVIDAHGGIIDVPLSAKREVAQVVVDAALRLGKLGPFAAKVGDRGQE